MNYIVDKEINLNESDALNSKSYADTLKATIKNTPKDQSFTIGLFGEWGSGKSSIVETTRIELENSESENIKFIIYDAWKYANDSFRRMFLLCVQNALGFKRTDLMNSFYLNESEDVEIKRNISTQKLLIIVLILILGLVFVNIIPMDYENIKLSLSILISFLGLFAAIFFKVFDEFKVNVQKPHLFSPEQFEDCFKEMIKKTQINYSKIDMAWKWVKGENYEKNINKLIVVIDNIDRCNKELAYELLTDTKSFLGQSNNVIFLIPVDDNALKQHILNSNSCNKEAEEFLRKFFNVTIRLKPLRTVELFDFANRLNVKNKLHFNPDTLDIVSKEYATNPRRIIQFFNNLITELHNLEQNMGKRFVEINESLISKLLIIREEWPAYYKFLCKNPHLFNSENEEKNKIIEKNPELKQFLDNSKAISNGYEIEIFEKILTNESVFNSIPSSLIDSINNQQYDIIGEYIEKDSDKESKIIDFLIEQLRKGISSSRFKTLSLNSFNFLIKINKNYTELNEYDNHRIQNIIEGKLNNFLHYSDNLKEIVNYIDTLTKQKINYFTEYLSETMDSEFNVSKEEYDSFSKALLKTIVEYSESHDLIRRLNLPIGVVFRYQEKNLIEFVPAHKVKLIISEVIIEHILLNLNQLDENSNELADIIFIAENVELSNILKEKIFEKFNGLYPNMNSRNHQYLLSIIENLTPLFNSLENYSKLNNNASEFVSRLFEPRNVGGRSLLLLSEIISDKSLISKVVFFIEKIYISSLNNISVSDYYRTIAESSFENRILVNQSFLRLIETNGFSLVPVFDIILSDDIYDESSFKLFEHIFTIKDKDKYRLSKNKLNEKIIDIAELIFANKAHYEQALIFFEKLISDERIAVCLSDIVASKSKGEILFLSQPLLKLAFDNITEEDNLFNYKNDIGILKAIGQSGEKKHLTKLTKLIVSKLLKSDTYEEAFEIIENSKNFNSRDRSKMLEYLEEITKDEKYAEKAEDLIKKLNGE